MKTKPPTNQTQQDKATQFQTMEIELSEGNQVLN